MGKTLQPEQRIEQAATFQKHPVMRAVVVGQDQDGVRALQLERNYPVPVPGKGEVLIRVLLAGICGTDLEIVAGYKSPTTSLVLGHEFVGVIAEIGPQCRSNLASAVAVGDRVVAELNCVPYGCTTSRTAFERAQDSSRTALGIFGKDGAFADFVTVPIENVHVVPEAISDLSAVFVEPLAAACQILEQISIPGSHKVGVLGAGRLGWLVTAVLAAFGKDVTVLLRQRRKRKSADGSSVDDDDLAKHFGARITVLEDSDTAQMLQDVFDNIVDCTGNPSGFETAVRLVKPRGTIVLKSTTATCDYAINMTPVVVKEIRVLGSRCGPFQVALRLLESGRLDVEKLIQEILPENRAEEGFRLAKQKGCLKVILRFGDNRALAS